MFGLGLGELAAIAVVAMVVVGPDRLPDLARQAARMVRTVRQMAQNAKADLSSHLGDDFKDLGLDVNDLRSLDPRTVVRDALLGHDDAPTAPPAAPAPPPPTSSVQGVPWDDEAT